MIGRQGSITSLSKYATGKSPTADLFNGSKSRDFCNSFWGVGDVGVNVLFARMRGATRTMDELKNFWKQRCLIEEEYATNLANLAKMTFGRDEIGEMRNSIDALRNETESQAGFHLQLALQIRNEIETQVAAFTAKQALHRTSYQVPIEKRFKAKQAHEAHVNKAREKYESDLLRINAYTAQLKSLKAEGGSNASKDMEKVQMKLARAQQTVQANEKDFITFSKALADSMPRWEQEWKDFCDKCQDIEEERLDFMRDNIWAYANGVSTLCVADDQSCEKIRIALDQVETEKDMEFFVEEYGTGNMIPDPPAYSTVPNGVTNPASSSSSSLLQQKITSRPAQFIRYSQRAAPAYQPPPEPVMSSPRQTHLPPRQSPPQSGLPPLPPQAPAPPPIMRRASSAAEPSDRHASRRKVSNAGSEAPSTRSGRAQGSQQGHGGGHGSTEPHTPSHSQGGQVSPQVKGHPSPNGIPRRNESVAARLDPPPAFVPPSEPSPQYERDPSPVLAPTSAPAPTPAPTPAPAIATATVSAPSEVPETPILFYVQALYDYTATIDEEFDFQAGDIIAVTATPDDGWWIGDLLDEARRIPGRNVFPSNFVRLF